MPPPETNKNTPSRVGGSIPSRATSSQEEDSRDTPGQNAALCVDALPDPEDTEAYSAWIDSLTVNCTCEGVDRPCDGLLAGGPCDDLHLCSDEFADDFDSHQTGLGQNAFKPWGFELWQHLHQEHGLILTESEMQDIVRLVEPLTEASEANAELIERLRDRTDSYLAAAARNVQTILWQSVMLDRLTASLDNIIESIPLVERSVYAEVIIPARLAIKAVMKGAPEA